MAATAERSIEGLKYERYIEVDGTTYHATANGPSFYNGLGLFRLEQVNESPGLHGSIYKDGGLAVTANRMGGNGLGSFSMFPPDLFVAFGEMCADSDFREVVEAVRVEQAVPA
jgi:hypothetical protein